MPLTMFQGNRIHRLAGAMLLLYAALLVVSIVLDGATTAANPLARGEVEQLLLDVNDHSTASRLLSTVNIASDAVVLLVVAAVLYLLLRDRSPLLALVGALGFVASSSALAATDAARLTLDLLAQDFAEGGPAVVGAGDAVTLGAARVVAAFNMLNALAAITMLGVGLVALGALLLWAPTGAVNPPRWLGGLGILAGMAMFLSWVAAADWEAGMPFLVVGMLATLGFLIVLGGWLLIRAERQQTRTAPQLAPDRSL